MRHFKIVQEQGLRPSNYVLVKHLQKQFKNFSFYFSEKHGCVVVNAPQKPAKNEAYKIDFEEIND